MKLSRAVRKNIFLSILITLTTIFNCHKENKKFLDENLKPFQVPRIEIVTTNILKPCIIVPIFPNGKKIDKEKEKKNLSLYLLFNKKKPTASIYGLTTFENNKMIFTPASKLSLQSEYLVEWKNKQRKIQVSFQTPNFIPTQKPLSRPKQFYPIGDKIPSNILMFYTIFNEKIQVKKNSLKFVKIFDKKKEIKKVWTYYGMPNIMRKQSYLSMMIHPGRKKTGVELQKKFGKVFQEGKIYTIKIDKNGFQDSYFRSLGDGNYQKKYTVGKHDKIIPKFLPKKSFFPNLSSMKNIKKNQNDLVLVFSEAMDYFSILEGVLIYPKKRKTKVPKERLFFSVTHDRDDSRWRFTPKNWQWQKGTYTIEITTTVKDLAHNNIRNRFELKPNEKNNNDSVFYFFEVK